MIGMRRVEFWEVIWKWNIVLGLIGGKNLLVYIFSKIIYLGVVKFNVKNVVYFFYK